MVIFPAIDLKDGKAVRLTKGLMNTAKVYSDEPEKLAKELEALGSSWLHVVDLNGAFVGEPRNVEQIKKIVNNTNLNIQVGGGIRDEKTIDFYINELKVSRVILGSIALKNPNFVKNMAKRYPIVVGIDAKDGFVAVEGWGERSNIKASELASRFGDAGVEAIICTDVGKDGTLSGVNLDFSEQIALASKLPTIASGGVKDDKDIQKVLESKLIFGLIIGKAYYEGNLDLKKVFEKIKV